MAETGRPPIYTDPKLLQNAIDLYFLRCEDPDPAIAQHPTITGLALACGFNSKDTLYEYEKKEGFSDSIKKARLRVEQAYEKRLYSQASTGAIFALKNFGWKDKSEHEINGSLTVSIAEQIKKAYDK